MITLLFIQDESFVMSYVRFDNFYDINYLLNKLVKFFN